MKQYYAGYNHYGTAVVGYTAIHAFRSRAERDAWVDRQYDDGRHYAEPITADEAYRHEPCLRTGQYYLDGSLVVSDPNVVKSNK